MKNAKPLSLVAAVAAASLGYSGAGTAQTLALNTAPGDMAIVPYYTVQPGFSTGIAIANNSDNSQVVKIRLRRGTDSMGALGFNLLLSPRDVWSGYLEATEEAGALTGLPVIRLVTHDASCTVPENAGSLTLPEIYRVGAEEGYIEVIGMGQPIDELQPIASSIAEDANGIPADCTRASDNFRRGSNAQDYYQEWTDFTGSASRTRGVVNSSLSAQYDVVNGVPSANDPISNAYIDTDNVLKVSYFIKSDRTGIEFGNNAVHIENFMDGATITNQTVGVFEGDLQGFDYPDLNGPAAASLGGVINNIDSSPAGAATARASYQALRYELGDNLVGDWSDNDQGAFSVDTDWVVAVPGQYLMVNLLGYLTALYEPDYDCLPGLPHETLGLPGSANEGENCDFRDIPMRIEAVVSARDGRSILVEEGDLVVSPQPPGPVGQNVLEQEVNVITWGTPVLNSARTLAMPKPTGARAGLAEFTANSSAAKIQAICDFVGQPGFTAEDLQVHCLQASGPAPLLGVVAWQRNFTDVPAANYGRIVKHSRVATSATP